MFAGSLKHPKTYADILTHEIWDQVFIWIDEQNLEELDSGEYVIAGKNISASVQAIDTIPRDEGVFEAHRTYIDVHYCISGSERIEWAPVETLTPTQEFDEEKDYGLYVAPPEASSILLTPGDFVVFLPEDGHMPKIQSGMSTETKKVVIKILSTLIQK